MKNTNNRNLKSLKKQIKKIGVEINSSLNKVDVKEVEILSKDILLIYLKFEKITKNIKKIIGQSDYLLASKLKIISKHFYHILLDAKKAKKHETLKLEEIAVTNKFKKDTKQNLKDIYLECQDIMGYFDILENLNRNSI